MDAADNACGGSGAVPEQEQSEQQKRGGADIKRRKLQFLANEKSDVFCMLRHGEPSF